MSPQEISVRSVVAMRAVNLDRQKFNEAVANGHYPCAPETVRGSTRTFNADDLIGLYVFARFLELDVVPRRAGRLACDFLEELKKKSRKKPAQRVTFVQSIAGMGEFIADFDNKTMAAMPSPTAFCIEFDLTNIWATISLNLEYELARSGNTTDD